MVGPGRRGEHSNAVVLACRVRSRVCDRNSCVARPRGSARNGFFPRAVLRGSHCRRPGRLDRRWITTLFLWMEPDLKGLSRLFSCARGGTIRVRDPRKGNRERRICLPLLRTVVLLQLRIYAHQAKRARSCHGLGCLRPFVVRVGGRCDAVRPIVIRGCSSRGQADSRGGNGTLVPDMQSPGPDACATEE